MSLSGVVLKLQASRHKRKYCEITLGYQISPLGFVLIYNPVGVVTSDKPIKGNEMEGVVEGLRRMKVLMFIFQQAT